MKSLKLDAQVRTVTGKQVNALRSLGMIPAVVYGRGTESQALSVPMSTFEKVYREAGESSLVDLCIDSGGAVKTLIHDVQTDPVSNRVVHVDFYAVTMTEKLTASIPLKFVGEPKAVKELGGTLLKNLSEVEVKCLPSDLVSEIEVDLSPLTTFEDAITIGNLGVPKGMEVTGSADTLVATVTPSISEAELKALEEKPVEDISAVEKVEQKKEEESTD